MKIEVDIIHTGKGLIPQETFGKKFEYIPCLLEQPYIELMDFKEFKKIWSRGRIQYNQKSTFE